MRQLVPLAEANNVAIIEDACQAHAAQIDGQPVGSFGTGCFSFYATKNITTGEAGIVTTNDPRIAERGSVLRNDGEKERYRDIFVGYNLRMTEIQGAIGLAQIAKLEQFTEQRIAHAAFLTKHLEGVVQTPITRPGYRHVYHQYTIRVPEKRDEWVGQLRSRGIGTGVHYPRPIHQQPFYQERSDEFRFVSSEQSAHTKNTAPDGLLPVTELAAKQELSLPLHPARITVT